jgi:ApaG protein
MTLNSTDDRGHSTRNLSAAPSHGRIKVVIATPVKIVWNDRLRRTSRPTQSNPYPMATAKKHEITVTTRTTYIPEQSDPESGRYVFAYTITLKNTGSVAAQLISRHWIITDANNQVQEVRGLGVVGEQPLLKSGESFDYTSGTAIATPVGTMRGSYQMVAEDGLQFDAPIPEFTLSMPRVLH